MVFIFAFVGKFLPYDRKCYREIMIIRAATLEIGPSDLF